MKKSYLITIFIFIVLSSFAYAVDVDDGVPFANPSLSNVTYFAPDGGLNCTEFTVNSTCLIIVGGGIFEGEYCIQSNVSVNISLGRSLVNVFIYDEQTEQLIDDRNITLEFIRPPEAYNYTTSSGTFLFGNLSAANWDVRYDADGYHPREYYFTVTEDSNATINLYLLNDSTDVSDRIVLTLYDENSDEANEVSIIMQRYFVSSNSYVAVSMARTNFEGQAVLYAEMYDVYYKLLYSHGGQLRKETNPSPFLTTTPVDKVNLGDDAYTSWRIYDNLNYNLTFENQTGTTFFKYVYVDSNNIVRNACLKVERHTLEGNHRVCYNCTNASSATLTCIINASLDGEYMAVALLDTNTTGSWYPLATEWYQPLADFEFAEEGVFFTIIWVGTLGMMGLGSILGSIVLMIIGLLSAWLIGIITGVNIGIIWYLVALGFIIIFLARKSK